MVRLASAFDGTWYPAEPDALREVVEHLMARAPEPPSDRVVGALVPHAGYVYSGRSAGLAIGQLAGSGPEAIVLLGPSHRVRLHGVRVFHVDGFEGPLGPLDSDLEVADALIDALGPEAKGEPFAEHSVELQLPFLATALPGVPVVEVLYGPSDLSVARRVAQALHTLGSDRWLVVASSDLSHFYQRSQAQHLDQRFAELLLEGDPVAMDDALAQGEVEACGSGPVLSLMCLAEATGGRFALVDQTDSSEASGDEDRVVGYLSALLTQPGAAV